MDDTDECTCGHVRDEHYSDGDGNGQGSACTVEGCDDCIAFEES